MIIPIDAGKKYREHLSEAIERARQRYRVTTPGISDAILRDLVSTAFREGWRSSTQVLDEEMGKMLNQGEKNDT